MLKLLNALVMVPRFWRSIALGSARSVVLALIAGVWAVGAEAQSNSGDALTYTVGDWQSRLQNWLAQPTMTGDWGGLRTQLEDKGINWQTWLTAEPVRNFNGYKGVATACTHHLIV
jgi:carbohydrate-selective porin OprB